LKENFGFIKHAQSDTELFFHYSELRDCDARDLDRGSEVEFGAYYDAQKDKTMGVRVIVLPRGTIKTEEVVKQDVEGVVTREMREKRSYDRGTKRELYGGVVRLSQEEKVAEGSGGERGGEEVGGAGVGAKGPGPKVQEWPFGGDDVELGDGTRPYTPAEGDVVIFDVVRVLARKQEKATNLRFLRAAPAPEIARESGVVEKIAKDSFGFIECYDRFSSCLYFNDVPIKYLIMN
jgi:cold shock CspA family protein